MFKLVCFDLDGVIFDSRNFWLSLHRVLGTLEEGKRATENLLYMDYGKLVEVVGKLWKGKPAEPYFKLVREMPYLPGVKEVFAKLKARHYKTAVLSSSSMDLARRAEKELGVDFVFANELIIRNNVITGEFNWPMGSGKEEKPQIIKQLCKRLSISIEQVVFVGDAENDILALRIAGLAIAFNTKDEEVKKEADVVVNNNDLKDILKHLP